MMQTRTRAYNVQGWGFCHEVCRKDYGDRVFSSTLKMVRLTILSEKMCRELGNIAKSETQDEIVVNTRKELCGAFVNEMNVTTVNYTLNTQEDIRRLYEFYK